MMHFDHDEWGNQQEISSIINDTDYMDKYINSIATSNNRAQVSSLMRA
jgi:hypothetical protein